MKPDCPNCQAGNCNHLGCDYCHKPIKARGLCAKHYLADYRERKAAGEIKEKTPLVYTSRLDNTCTVVTCTDKTRAKGLCTKHYFQTRRAA